MYHNKIMTARELLLDELADACTTWASAKQSAEDAQRAYAASLLQGEVSRARVLELRKALKVLEVTL